MEQRQHMFPRATSLVRTVAIRTDRKPRFGLHHIQSRYTNSVPQHMPRGPSKVPQNVTKQAGKILEKRDKFAAVTDMRTKISNLAGAIKEGIKQAIQPLQEKAAKYPIVQRMLKLISNDANVGKKIVLAIIVFTPAEELLAAWLLSKVIPQKYQDKIKEFVTPILEQADAVYKEHADDVYPLVKSFVDHQKLSWGELFIDFADINQFLGEVSSARIDETFDAVEIDWLTRLASFAEDYLGEYEIPAEYAWLLYSDFNDFGDYNIE